MADKEIEVQDTDDYKLSKSGRKIRAHRIVFNKGEDDGKKGITEMKKSYKDFVEQHTAELTEEQKNEIVAELDEAMGVDPISHKTYMKGGVPHSGRKDERHKFTITATVKGRGGKEEKIEQESHAKGTKDEAEAKLRDHFTNRLGYKISSMKHMGTVKEEAELDERTMTDAEMKKREEYVKGMKKNVAGFKAKYGERAKDVMYATATKMAMKEEEHLDERNKENAIRRKMMDASRGARWKVQNKMTGDDVRDWDGKHKTAQAQNKAIGRALRNEDLDEAVKTITLVGTSKHIRPGQEDKHEVVKHHGKSSDGSDVYTVKQPNGFHGVLAIHHDKKVVTGSTQNNHDEATTKKIADHYVKHGQVGLKQGWHAGSSMYKLKESIDEEQAKKQNPPFDPPYKTATGNIKDKSGAVHTPMSRARDLARQAMKKQMKEHFGVDITDEQADSLVEAANVSEELKGSQHKLDKNKNGKLDKHDFKLLRKEESMEESVFDWKNKARQTSDASKTKTYHDVKKISTGTVYTKQFDKDGVSKGTGDDAAKKAEGAPKRGRGRPKKDKFAEAVEFLLALSEEHFDDMMEEGFDAFIESYEQLDELSKATLGSYAKKAKTDIAHRSYDQGSDDEMGRTRSNYNDRKLGNRLKGVNKAIDRLTK